MNIHQRLQRNIVGGIVAGIGSMFGAGINAASQRKENDLNRLFQMEENQKNRDWEEHMYNTYETPAAQRQQMLEAGLNPMGAISPQSVGSASTSAISTGPAPQWGSSLQEAIPAFYDAALAAQEVRNKRLEATGTELDNWAKAFENGNAEELYQTQLAAIKANTALTREQKRKQREEIKALKFTYKKAKEAYEEGANEFKDAHRAADDAHDLAEFNKRIASVSADVVESTKDYQIKKSEAEMKSALEAAEVAVATRQHSVDLAKATRDIQELVAIGAREQFNYNQWMKTFISLLGFDPRILPPALQATTLYELDGLVKDYPDGIPSSAWKTFNQNLADRLHNYRTKDYHIPSTYSSSTGFQILGSGINSSSSFSN